MSNHDLFLKVQRFGDKPMSDGITIDNAGNVYVTDITNNALGVISPEGKYKVLFQDEKLSWTDGFATQSNGKLLVTINQLHRSPVLNGGENGSSGEFYIV